MTCHKPGHLAKHHAFFQRVMIKYKRGTEDVTVSIPTIEDDNYGDSLCWNFMLTTTSNSDDDTNPEDDIPDLNDSESEDESDYEDELCYMTDSDLEDAPEGEDDLEYR